MFLMVIVRVTIVTNRAVMMSIGGHEANSANDYLISKP